MARLLGLGLLFTFTCSMAFAKNLDICDRGRIGELLTNATGSANCSSVSEEALAALIYLDWGSQGIYSVPNNAFAGLKGLRHLKLRDNEIADIVGILHPDLRGLTHLDLGNNKLAYFAFPGALASLESLYLDGNQLTEITPYTFIGLYNLRRLMVSNNQISTISDDSFKKMASLESLVLHGNQLTEIKTETFWGPWFLEELSLGDNRIEKIEKDAFVNHPKLMELDLAGNKLERISRTHVGLKEQTNVHGVEIDQ